MLFVGLKDTESCGNKSLAELGMDSLMGTEIRQTLERKFDLLISAQEIRNLTFGKLNELAQSAGSQSEPNKQKVSMYFILNDFN